MKLQLLLLIFLLSLASCTVIKRKYLPGYSINREHKTPTLIVGSSDADKHDKSIGNTPALLQPLMSVKQHATSSSFMGLVGHLGHLPASLLSHESQKSKPAINPETSATLQISPLNIMQCSRLKAAHFPNPVDSLNNHRVECKEANTCLTTGIFAFALPTAIMSLAYLSAQANSNNSNFDPIFLYILAGLFAATFGITFLILTLVYSNRAYKKMEQEPNKYSGKLKVTIGVILAVIIPTVLVLLGILSPILKQP